MGVLNHSVLNHRLECDRCGGAPSRAVRSRQVAENADPVYYLAFTWACSVCGNSWVDAGLERVNAQAERAARRDAREARHLTRHAS